MFRCKPIIMSTTQFRIDDRKNNKKFHENKKFEILDDFNFRKVYFSGEFFRHIFVANTTSALLRAFSNEFKSASSAITDAGHLYQAMHFDWETLEPRLIVTVHILGNCESLISRTWSGDCQLRQAYFSKLTRWNHRISNLNRENGHATLKRTRTASTTAERRSARLCRNEIQQSLLWKRTAEQLNKFSHQNGVYEASLPPHHFSRGFYSAIKTRFSLVSSRLPMHSLEATNKRDRRASTTSTTTAECKLLTSKTTTGARSVFSSPKRNFCGWFKDQTACAFNCSEANYLEAKRIAPSRLRG